MNLKRLYRTVCRYNDGEWGRIRNEFVTSSAEAALREHVHAIKTMKINWSGPSALSYVQVECPSSQEKFVFIKTFSDPLVFVCPELGDERGIPLTVKI